MRKTILTAFTCLSLVLIGCEDKSSASKSSRSDPDKASIEGIDSDNNGIRDDIEIAILGFAPLPEQEPQRDGLMRTAKGFQAALLAGDANDTQAALAAWDITLKGLQCLSEKYPDGENNAAAQAVGASASFDEGKLKIANASSQTIASGVYGAANTPEAFLNLFAPLNAAIAANASASGGSLEANAVISQATSLVSLDSSGKVVSGANVTLDNFGTPISFAFNLRADPSQSESASVLADGVREGAFEGYSIDQYGRIIAAFDNGRESAIAQIAVFHFANDGGLMRVGGTQFMESANSGAPFFFIDANGAQLSSVAGNTLEGSNVQAAIALSDLIVYQRSYEGAARAISTNDQMIQNAINLKR
jgi:flagellar hook-basal body protein